MPENKRKLPPTVSILIAMIIGILAGYLINTHVADKAAVAGYVSILSDIFLRLIKMLIAPLVFSTLVVGSRPHG